VSETAQQVYTCAEMVYAVPTSRAVNHCRRGDRVADAESADAETVLQTRRLQTERLRWDNGPTTASEYICRRGDRAVDFKKCDLRPLTSVVLTYDLTIGH
jgi:hypothetical protein